MEAVEVHPRFIEEREHHASNEHEHPPEPEQYPEKSMPEPPSAVMIFLSRYKVHIIVFLIVFLVIILGYLIFWYEPTPVVPIRTPPEPPHPQFRPQPKQEEPDYESVLNDINKAKQQRTDETVGSTVGNTVGSTVGSTVDNTVGSTVDNTTNNSADVTIDIPEEQFDVTEDEHLPEQEASYQDDSVSIEMNLMDTHVNDVKKKKRCATVLANGQQCKKMSYNNTCNLHQSA
jgi:hypothetical protein